MMGLLEMLSGHEDAEDKALDIHPDAAIARMQERAPLYAEAARGPRFAIGEVVTPFPDASVNDSGKPHLVIAVLPNAGWVFDGEIGTSNFGRRFDMRVLKIRDDSIYALWVESAEFMKYPNADGTP